MEYTFHNIDEGSNQLFKRPKVCDADPHWPHQQPPMDSLLFLPLGQAPATGGRINNEYRFQVRASRYTNILPTNQLGNTLALAQAVLMDTGERLDFALRAPDINPRVFRHKLIYDAIFTSQYTPALRGTA